MATDIGKVTKFEDGLKLSIRGKIVGFLLQDMDSMVRTAMAIEREIDDVSNSALGLLYGHGILTIYENLLL